MATEPDAIHRLAGCVVLACEASEDEWEVGDLVARALSDARPIPIGGAPTHPAVSAAGPTPGGAAGPGSGS